MLRGLANGTKKLRLVRPRGFIRLPTHNCTSLCRGLHSDVERLLGCPYITSGYKDRARAVSVKAFAKIGIGRPPGCRPPHDLFAVQIGVVVQILARRVSCSLLAKEMFESLCQRVVQTTHEVKCVVSGLRMTHPHTVETSSH